MNNAALAAGATVSFTLNNSTLAAGDFVITHHYFAGTLGAYRVDTHTTAIGSVVIRVKNESASSLSETIQIRFMVLRGVAS